MLIGIKLRAYPNNYQKVILNQWMGCARTIWNAKVEEEKYLSTFAKKYLPIKTYAPIDQTYSQYKNKMLTPWLYQCPSQVLRNASVNWYQTYQNFIKGRCGKPKRKKYSDKGSIHLTRELFNFETCPDNNLRLFIGTKKNNIGWLAFKKHKKFKMPASIYIKRENNRYYVSFCYENKHHQPDINKDHLSYLKECTYEFLEMHTIGIDRGIMRPVQTNRKSYDLTWNQKKNKQKQERYIKRLQRKLSKQKLKSVRWKKTKTRLSNHCNKIKNIRKDFCHKTSHALVTDENNKVIVFEDLKTKNMSKRPNPKNDDAGRFLENGAKAKSGLNKSILDKGWYQLELYTRYKCAMYGKAFFKIDPKGTSQECAKCDFTHPSNRRTQTLFVCLCCGNVDNADHNAALVIKKRAIKFILDSGTELSDRDVLISNDKGRRVQCKTSITNVIGAANNDPSKKKSKHAA